MSSPAALVQQLHGLIDQLLSVDHAALDAAALHQLVVEVQAERARLCVAAGEAIGEWEHRDAWRADGTLRAPLALGRDTKSCHQQARHELRRARLLARLPHTRAAVLAGRLSIDHVDLFLRYATAARFELFLQHEQALVEQCAQLRLFDDARRAVQYWAQLADDLLDRQSEGPAPSTLYASRSAADGMLHLHGDLGAVDGEIVERELTRLAREIHLADRAAGVRRSPAQRRAAALVRMATRSVNSTGVTARPLFQVLVGDETARRLCELASGIVVRPLDLAPHIDSAVMEAFLFDGPSTVVATSHRRTFTGALRRAIQVRDRRCTHASGCPTPAVDADVDHSRPAARGGPTSQFNGRILCAPHNRHAHLRDPADALPERRLEWLDALRCRLRWNLLHGDDP